MNRKKIYKIIKYPIFFIIFIISFFIINYYFDNQIQAENSLPLSGLADTEQTTTTVATTESTEETSIKKECIDYDQGQNFYEKNKAELRELGVENPLITTKYDTCNEDGSLKEWYCADTPKGPALYGAIFDCPNGCQNGACLTSSKKPSADYARNNSLFGKLLLQVEDHGRIWYVDFNGDKHEVTFANALSLFETLAVGITNNNLYQIPMSYDSWHSNLANSLKGKLLLQVEDHGRIWYVDFNGQRHEVTWNNLMDLFKSLSLGITNNNLSKIATYNDYDNDGLSDADELNFYKTNPYNADTDGDGYQDGEEVKNGYNPLGEGLLGLEFMDTDNDGLSDADELNFYKTNPYNADTDGDGYQDGEEVKNGYNPLGTDMRTYSDEILVSLVYGGAKDDTFKSFYVSGNYIYAIGNTNSEGSGANNILIVKFDRNDLSIKERKVYGEAGNEYLYSLYADQNYIYAVGSSDVLGQGGKEGLLIKLNKSNLEIVNQKTYGGIKDDVFYNLGADEEYLYLVGYTKSNSNNNSDTLLVKFNKSDLNLIDKKVYGGSSADYFKAIYVDQTYLYAVGGTQSLGEGNNDLLLVKFNKNLGLIERKVIGNAANNYFNSVYADQNYIYAVGQTKIITREHPDALIAKFNKVNLDNVQFKAYGLSSSADSFQDVYADQNYIYATGSVSSINNNGLDAVIVRIPKTNFNTEKAKVLSGKNSDVFTEIYSDGNYIYTSGQTKLDESYDAILNKINTFESGTNNTQPENFSWGDSNLDFFDIHLISTDSQGLELTNSTSSTDDYIILGSDSFSFNTSTTSEETTNYEINIASSTIEYNQFDVNIAPPLTGLTTKNFLFTEDEVALKIASTTEVSSTEDSSTYNIALATDEDFKEFKENSVYQISVLQFTDTSSSTETTDVLKITNPILTAGYQNSAQTDSHLNISKYIINNFNNNNLCENYACCTDNDCDDHLENTIDTCINPYFDNAYCQHQTIAPELECLSDIDCNDGLSCTKDTCLLESNTCLHTEITKNIDDDTCCLESVWNYEFVPWHLDNDCPVAQQTNSALIINPQEKITSLSSDNNQGLILLQEFIYDANDAINHGSKVLLGELTNDNVYKKYNDFSGNGVLIIRMINATTNSEKQTLTINIGNRTLNIYLPALNPNIANNVDYYIASNGASYYSLYKGQGSFMSPLEAFIEQNLAQDNSNN